MRASPGLVRRAFEKGNMNVELVVARDATEALDHLLRGHRARAAQTTPFPAVLLLDLKLPGMSGLELIRRLRTEQRTKLLPIIVLTSSDDPQNIAACYRAGADSYVLKPTDVGKFDLLLRQLIDYWLGVNHPPQTIGAQ